MLLYLPLFTSDFATYVLHAGRQRSASTGKGVCDTRANRAGVSRYICELAGLIRG